MDKNAIYPLMEESRVFILNTCKGSICLKNRRNEELNKLSFKIVKLDELEVLLKQPVSERLYLVVELENTEFDMWFANMMSNGLKRGKLVTLA